MGEVARIDGFRGVGGEVGKKCMWYSICHAQCGTQNVEKFGSDGMHNVVLKISKNSYLMVCT